MAELLRPGHMVHLVAPTGDAPSRVIATVLRVADESFYISPPERDGRKVTVVSQQIGVQLPLADAIYHMVCTVLAIESTGVRLSKPSPDEIRRTQRREFARSATDLACRMRVSDEHGKLGEPFEARVIDISGGGASILHPQPLVVDSAVKLVFDLPNDDTIELHGSIVRVRVLASLTQTRYCAGVRFENLTERTRSRIIRYVFSMQRELTRWGKQFK